MARHQLTDSKLKAAKFIGRPAKLWDGGGLYLHLLAATRTWRVKYRVGDKERDAKIGRYPALSLADARRLALEIERKVAMGIDPEAEAREEARAAVTFETVCREWLEVQESRLEPGTHELARRRLEIWALPIIGGRPILELEPPEVLAMLRKIEAAGKGETAKRVRQLSGSVFRYGIQTGQCVRDPTADLHGALRAPRRGHRAAVTDPAEFGALLRAIDGYGGQLVTKAALQLLALTFVRPGELRLATWGEIDFEGAQWRIPAPRTKMRRDHAVPLAEQALGILRDLQPLTDRGPDSFVFPAIGKRGRPISENTVNLALRRMDYGQDQMCAHGFRSSASSLLHELGWAPDLIELQLAHQLTGVRGIYNRAARLEERREMMQAWADHLDTLREGAKVVPIRGRR